MRKVKCKSGITGWQAKLQKVYSNLEEFIAYCENYNIHKRLGFKTPESAWNQNPVIEGSTCSSDLRVVK